MTDQTDNLVVGIRGVRASQRMLRGSNPSRSERELMLSDLAAAENILRWCSENRDVIREAQRKLADG